MTTVGVDAEGTSTATVDGDSSNGEKHHRTGRVEVAPGVWSI